jgi:WD40 repeat protein
VWDVNAGGKPLINESLHSEPATCVEFCGLRGASGSAAHDLPVFDLSISTDGQSGSCSVVQRLELGRSRGINDLRVRPSDCKIFATAGWDHRIRIFAWKRPRPLAVIKFHEAGVTSVDFNPIEPSYMASGSQDTRIAIWKIY